MPSLSPASATVSLKAWQGGGVEHDQRAQHSPAQTAGCVGKAGEGRDKASHLGKTRDLNVGRMQFLAEMMAPIHQIRRKKAHALGYLRLRYSVRSLEVSCPFWRSMSRSASIRSSISLPNHGLLPPLSHGPSSQFVRRTTSHVLEVCMAAMYNSARAMWGLRGHPG